MKHQQPTANQARAPGQVVAVVGDDHAGVSDLILALAHAARAASMEAQAYRHCDAHPPMEPLLFACPPVFLPHAEIASPGRRHSIIACPISGRPRLGPIAPVGLADVAVWVVTPEQVGSGLSDAQLLELRGAGLPLAAVVLQGSSEDSEEDRCIRTIREQLYAHEYDGDSLPVLGMPRLAPPDQAPDPVRFSQALHGALSLLEHLEQAPLRPPGLPAATPWLAIGDTRPLTRTQTYVVARIQAGSVHARAELRLTGIRADHEVVTRVLQRRGGRAPGVMHAGELVWMHIEHRPGIRVDPGMLLFESGALERAQAWEVKLEAWGDLSETSSLRVGARETPIHVLPTGDGQARLTSKTPLHMPPETSFCLLNQGQITVVGQINKPLPPRWPADSPPSG